MEAVNAFNMEVKFVRVYAKEAAKPSANVNAN